MTLNPEEELTGISDYLRVQQGRSFRAKDINEMIDQPELLMRWDRILGKIERKLRNKAKTYRRSEAGERHSVKGGLSPHGKTKASKMEEK